MKKGKLLLSAAVLTGSMMGIAGIALAVGPASGSGAMAAAVSQANDAKDYVSSLMTNITTEYNATNNITRSANMQMRPGSGAVQSIYSDSNGVITVKYRHSGIAGPLQDVILTFTPQHGGEKLRPGYHVSIEDWTCTYRPSPRVKGQRQYGVLHNIFVYAEYPLNICVRGE